MAGVCREITILPLICKFLPCIYFGWQHDPCGLRNCLRREIGIRSAFAIYIYDDGLSGPDGFDFDTAGREVFDDVTIFRNDLTVLKMPAW